MLSSLTFHVTLALILAQTLAFTPRKFGHANVVKISESRDDNSSTNGAQQETYNINGYSTSGYHDMLEERGTIFQKLFGPRVPKAIEDNEDGWGEMRKKNVPLWEKAIKLPLKASKRLLSRPQQPGTLILIRHGQSEW